MIQTLAMLCCVLILSTCASAKIIVKEIDYKAGDTDMMGYVAYDDEASGQRPGVAIVHEWWGNNDYPKMRAQELAKLGYVAFAVDMFGKGKTTDDPKTAGEWAGSIKKDPKLARERAQAGLSQLMQQPNVDREKIGAIGYCFGGTVVLQMARYNAPVKAVVSFHGDLTPIEPAKEAPKAKILVCNGDADSFVPPAQIDAFK